MYSPTKDNNNIVRMGDNKKIIIIKGKRKIKDYDVSISK
jgi:hypothetical protein